MQEESSNNLPAKLKMLGFASAAPAGLLAAPVWLGAAEAGAGICMMGADVGAGKARVAGLPGSPAMVTPFVPHTEDDLVLSLQQPSTRPF